MPRPKLTEPRFRLRQRGGYWQLSWTDRETGKTAAVSTRTADRREAEIWRDQYLAGLAQPLPPTEPIIADILDGYLAAREAKVAAYARLEWGSKVVRRLVGNLEPQMLTPAMFTERRSREGVADGTIRREIAVLRAALNWATRQQPPWIPRAPFIEAPPAPPPRSRWLTREEIGALLRASLRTPHLYLFVMLAYYTAARSAAILDLTWERVDFEARRIELDRPGRRRTNKRRAVVPIAPELLSALQTARQHATCASVIEFRGKPVASIKKAFAVACRRAAIEGCSPHVLRHTAATHMVMAAAPLRQVARLLGDTEATIERVYGKHSPDYLREAVDALSGVLAPRLVSDSGVK
jgi:integrase